MSTKSIKLYNSFTLNLSENGFKKLVVSIHGHQLLSIVCGKDSNVYFQFQDGATRDTAIWDRKTVQNFVDVSMSYKNGINKHNCPTCTLGTMGENSIQYTYNHFCGSKLSFKFGDSVTTFSPVDDNFLKKLDQLLQPILNSN